MQCLHSRQVVRQACAVPAGHARSASASSGVAPRRRCRVHATAQTTYDGIDAQVFMQTGGITYARPSWHPFLFRPSCLRSQLESSVRQYYQEVMNNCCVDLLSELCAFGVTYSDALGFVEDAFGIKAMQSIIQDFQSTHPLLRYQVDEVIVDEQRHTVVVHYTATAAHLLPSREGVPATGHVSTVQGMDKFRFDRFGLCTSIQSYRQRFADEEELQLIDWDTV